MEQSETFSPAVYRYHIPKKKSTGGLSPQIATWTYLRQDILGVPIQEIGGSTFLVAESFPGVPVHPQLQENYNGVETARLWN